MSRLSELHEYKQALLTRIDKTRKLMALAPNNKQPLSQALVRKDEMMLAQIEQEIAGRKPDTNNGANYGN
jgi:hypothetical protein